MRRGPTLAMCAVSGLVLVGALKAGAHGVAGSTQGAAPAGVVVLAPATHPAHRTAAARPATERTRRATAPTAAAPSRPAARRTASAAPRATTAPKPAAKPAVVVNGRGVMTPYGMVQVQVTISGHRITRAEAIAHPHGSGQSDQINSYAVPQLDQETLNAQSSRIDTVSGATYTSDAYRTSLQSALDSAHSAGAW